MPSTTYSFVADSPEETAACGEALGRSLLSGDVVGLSGDLGAGKTHFAQGVGRGLDADPQFPVCSPTFTLINEHPARIRLYHIDLYRLGDVEEMIEMGLFEILGNEDMGVCLVEWIERLEGDIPDNRLDLHLQAVTDDSRRITATAFGPRAEALLQGWEASLAPVIKGGE